MFDLDRSIERVRQCQCLPENDLRELCELVKGLLIEEATVQSLSSPRIVCGDIHGQFYDLLKLFEEGGVPPHSRYIFLGDYVDRGDHSVETLQLLLLYKAKYPDCVTLLRGNHESRQVTRHYGFYDECVRKYGNANAWKYCTDVFDLLSIAAVIDGRVFCVHGGLSPAAPSIDIIQMIPRMEEVPHHGAFCDLMWSDPSDIETWQQSLRGAGYLFGSQVTREFNHNNALELVCRAHQLVQDGFKYWFEDKSLITVWSAPNYCYRCGNVAAMLKFDDQLNREVALFTESKHSRNSERRALPHYFL